MDPSLSRGSDLEEGSGVGPLSLFGLEDTTLVDQDLPILADADGRSLERARGRALEVDPGHVIAAAVARAFELLFRGEPVRRAAEVRADRDEGIHDPLVGIADDP